MKREKQESINIGVEITRSIDDKDKRSNQSGIKNFLPEKKYEEVSGLKKRITLKDDGRYLIYYNFN